MFKNEMRVSFVCTFSENSYISGKYVLNCKRVGAQVLPERRVNRPVKCRLLLSCLNKDWFVSTEFNKTIQHELVLKLRSAVVFVGGRMNGLAKLMGVFLGAFAKKKKTASFVLSVHKELSPHWTEVYKI